MYRRKMLESFECFSANPLSKSHLSRETLKSRAMHVSKTHSLHADFCSVSVDERLYYVHGRCGLESCCGNLKPLSLSCHF